MRPASVYVVDDEEQICTLLSRILGRDGLRVQAFSRASAALAAMESEMPDLVVTDLMMPEVNGLELAARVKSLDARTSVIVITGYASLENVVDALRSGVDDFVTKPFSVAEICAVVRRVLARRGADAAAPAPAAESAAAAQRPVSAQPVSAPGPASPAQSVAPPGRDVQPALARRLRDVALLESMHALLRDEIDSRDLAERAAPTLQAALSIAAVAIAGLTGSAGRLALLSASNGLGVCEREDDLDAPGLVLVDASGGASPVDSAALGDAAALFGAGPVAAAPLGADGERTLRVLLVVARAEGGRPFDGEELRSLGVAAAALGDVWRGIRAAESAEEAYLASLRDVVTETERRGAWFVDHALRVRRLSVRLGERMGLPDAELDVLDAAAGLLDIGRIRVQDSVLVKTERLSSDEWRALRRDAPSTGTPAPRQAGRPASP